MIDSGDKTKTSRSNIEEKNSTAAACSLAMQRIINASRYEKSDVAEFLGISTQSLDKRMRGIISFALEEALMICKLVDIPLTDALKIADMSDEEFQNAWIFQWRRQNFAKHIAHLEADKGYTQVNIAEKCGYSQAWLSRVLSGKAKLIGRVCRVLEQRLDLPEEWLDRKPLSPPKGQQVNTDLISKTSSQLLGAVKQAGFDVDSELLVPYLTAVVQLYNARVAVRDGFDPETDAAQFQTIFDQLTMQLKMKEGLWKF
ncbi:helix-turn-helix domain-containing protein [Marinomonas spartinae]|uniref:helix-turn-helix domain-containing protein n=1 Tax=Marinomonas spartinae TaxID=1792290 RepID=UPI0018F10A22|nr:helix-turn-helix transcriptional regulator [Marinomonas spartinae]MBJ7555418.1 helix-turn-helix transcriptional regulator [Marinomonas spartinae]